MKPIDMLFGKERRVAKKTQTCVICKGPAEVFKDALSKREFEISRMCQGCQDKVFTK